MTGSESSESMGKAALQRRGQVTPPGRIPLFSEQAALSQQWILRCGIQYADYIGSVHCLTLRLRNKSVKIFSSKFEFSRPEA